MRKKKLFWFFFKKKIKIKLCGETNSWKRNPISKGKFIKFGYAEFATVEGVLNCQRLLNDFQVLDSKLTVKAGKNEENFLNSWKDLK